MIIPCIIFFFSGNALEIKKNCFQTETKKDSIVAVYHFINKAQKESIALELYKNNTYTFSVHGDHYDYYSKGTWEKNKDTIVVNSFIQKKEIPITITQSYTKTNSPYIQIDDIKNSTAFLFKDIEILINKDSSKSCYANVGSNCKIKKEDLKSIKIRLVGNTTSAWHPIELAENNNTLKIMVDIDFIPEFYVFFKNKKFIKRWRKLYDPDLDVYYKKGRLRSVKK
jgi:hypothetical protein